MGMSGIYGPADESESLATIHAALERGVTLLDTGDYYGMGQNELLISRALRGKRDKAVVSVKFGVLRAPDGTWLMSDARPAAVKNFLAHTLTRLGLDHVDIYRPGRLDPAVPIEDTVGAMAKLVQQGKVRALGLSEAAPKTIARAHKVHPIAAVQNEFSLLYREQADDTRKTTRELGISFVAYAPLGRGLLTADIADPATLSEGDTRKRQPRYAGDNLAHNRALAQKVEAIAKRKGCTPAQLALAWVLAQGDDVVPIPGTKQKTRLLENIGALKVQLSASDLGEISSAVPAGAVKGTRYPEAQMASLYI